MLCFQIARKREIFFPHSIKIVIFSKKSQKLSRVFGEGEITRARSVVAGSFEKHHVTQQARGWTHFSKLKVDAFDCAAASEPKSDFTIQFLSLNITRVNSSPS